ncbi:MAG TPA: imidazole glycerol phosphate synthase subunit HisH [Acetobacteraceae bacterium]|nr:imidazole glycerol phosphate synthase subunit HisH [Acetobacteraceae bacterium]
MTRIAVVDYGSGNLASAARGLAVAAERAGRVADIVVTADPETVRRADRVVLPGQGAFADCARGLQAIPGLLDALRDNVAGGAPFLGICVGMQLMAARGLEHEITPGLGWIAGEIARMDVPSLPLPHMGWNELDFEPGRHPLLEGLEPGDHAYFVHSYALSDGNPDDLLATTDYGGTIAAMVARGNCAGTQFHVEKSQQVGLRILQNFIDWTP